MTPSRECPFRARVRCVPGRLRSMPSSRRSPRLMAQPSLTATFARRSSTRPVTGPTSLRTTSSPISWAIFRERRRNGDYRLSPHLLCDSLTGGLVPDTSLIADPTALPTTMSERSSPPRIASPVISTMPRTSRPTRLLNSRLHIVPGASARRERREQKCHQVCVPRVGRCCPPAACAELVSAGA